MGGPETPETPETKTQDMPEYMRRMIEDTQRVKNAPHEEALAATEEMNEEGATLDDTGAELVSADTGDWEATAEAEIEKAGPTLSEQATELWDDLKKLKRAANLWTGWVEPYSEALPGE